MLQVVTLFRQLLVSQVRILLFFSSPDFHPMRDWARYLIVIVFLDRLDGNGFVRRSRKDLAGFVSVF